ncbi:MAG: FG-GAP repeat domain-containing protein, partial [Pseudomonadota bacterium]
LYYMDRYVDVNNDKKADLLWFHEEGDRFRVFLTNSTATGSIPPAGDISYLMHPNPVPGNFEFTYSDFNFLDVNLDGFVDVVASEHNANKNNNENDNFKKARWVTLGVGTAEQNMAPSARHPFNKPASFIGLEQLQQLEAITGTLLSNDLGETKNVNNLLPLLFEFGFDLNGDGRFDTLYQDPETRQLFTYLQKIDGTGIQVVANWLGPVNDLYGRGVKTHLDNDGLLDCLYVAADGGVWLSVATNDASAYQDPILVAQTPAAIKKTLTKNSSAAEFAGQRPELLDVNTDGRLDLVWGQRYVQLSMAPTKEQYASNSSTYAYFSQLIDTEVDWDNLSQNSAAANVLQLFAQGGYNDVGQDANGDERKDAYLLDWKAKAGDQTFKRRMAMRNSNGSWTFDADWAVATLTELAGNKSWFDLTGDGIADAIWRDRNNYLWVAVAAANNSTVSYANAVKVYTDPNNAFGLYQSDQVEYFDVNADGMVDVVWNPLSVNPQVLLNQAQTNTNPVQTVALSTTLVTGSSDQLSGQLAQFSAVDINSDGRYDMVAKFGSYGRAFVWLQNADGSYNKLADGARTFAPQTFVNVEVRYYKSGSLKGNLITNPDAITTETRTGVQQEITAVQTAGDAAKFELTGDGQDDVVWRDYQNNIWISRARTGTRFWNSEKLFDFKGALQQALSAEQLAALGFIPDQFVANQVIYRDVNFDGLLDIVWRAASYHNDASDRIVAKAKKDELWVSFANINGGFYDLVATNALNTSDASLALLAKNDLNGDGRADVLLNLGGRWRSWLAQSDGSFVEVQQAGLQNIVSPTAPDNPGIYATQAEKTKYTTDLATYETAQSKAYRRAVGEYSTADIDGDGTADAVWRDGYDVLWVTIAQSDRQQSFDSGTFDAKRLDLNLANTTDEVRSANFLDYTVKLADFNGDGIADILRIKTSDKRAGANTGTLRYGLGDGSFGEAQVLTAGLLDSNLPGDATTTWSTYLADINGDGLLDLVRAGALLLGFELVVSLGTGDESKGIFSTDIKQTSTNTGGTLSFTDVNADGYSDAVFESTNDQGVVTKKVAYGRSDGGFEAIIEGSAR